MCIDVCSASTAATVPLQCVLSCMCSFAEQPAAAAQLLRFEREIFGDAVVDADAPSSSPSGGFGGAAEAAWSLYPNSSSDPSDPSVGFGAGGDASFAFCRNVGDPSAPFVFGAGGNGNG